MNKGELWKSVTDYEGLYEVSSLGRVRAFERIKRGAKHKDANNKVLSQYLSDSGYWRVTLFKYGVKKNKMVAVLVAEAFVDNPCNLSTVIHLDGDVTNNAVSNLKWGTHAEAMQRCWNRRKGKQ